MPYNLIAQLKFTYIELLENKGTFLTPHID